LNALDQLGGHLHLVDRLLLLLVPQSAFFEPRFARQLFDQRLIVFRQCVLGRA
jgi:hypothetical protein